MTDRNHAGVSREAVLWAIRLFLGREPRDEAEIAFHSGHSSLDSLRLAFGDTTEFTAFQRRHHAPQPYRAPLFLLQPPQWQQAAWNFSPPSIARPASQLCTAGQFAEPAYAAWCQAMGVHPVTHRKQWEFVWILAVLEQAGLLREGARALGFGVGQEPLPAVFAQRGMRVLATDAPPWVVQDQGWSETGQYASGLEALDRPDITPFEVLQEQVGFDYADMNAIPAEYGGYDCCWSACALEHLGSLANGLRFIEASLETLRPGGMAVHTTEFTLSSNDETFESPGLSLFRKRDMEALAAKLADAGHEVWPLNFHPGDAMLDEHIDLPPYAAHDHLKLEVARHVVTSIGFAVRKRG